MNITSQTFSHIVTAPDFIESGDHTVVIIDPTVRELEDLGLFLKTAKQSFTVYVYKVEMNNKDWLMKAIANSTTIIINSIPNELSPIKDKLAVNSEAFYYGEKNFLQNKNRLETPIDYFAAYIDKHK